MSSEPERGFTLLEILVALVIVGLALGTLFHGVGAGVTAMSFADQQRTALLAGQSMLEQLGNNREVADDTTEGVLPSGQSWRLAISPLPVDRQGPPAPLVGHLVRLTVSWQQDGRSSEVELRTLLVGTNQ